MSGEERAVGQVLDMMERGVRPTAPIAGVVSAYDALFHARFDEALLRARAAAPSSDYARAVTRQVEALCTASTTDPIDLDDVRAVDVASRVGAMTVFHTSEAAHVLGQLDTCAAMVARALGTGRVERRAESWLRLSLTRGLLFSGDVRGAREQLLLVRPTAPLVAQAVRCLGVMIEGLGGQQELVVRLAEDLRSGLTAPWTYADAGLALLGAFGLVSCGFPGAASELLRHGSGGPGLPLLPPALRAYGFDVLIEAAVAAGNHELAVWMLADLDRLDLGENQHLRAAREASRLRVRAGLGSPTARAQALLRAREADNGLVAARVAMATALAEAADGADRDAVSELLSDVTSADLRAWAIRALEREGALVRPLAGIGWDQLTPSQAVVARLAARGLSNQEIARLLVVSRRTVETHVAAILDALRVSNRIGIVGSLSPLSEAAPLELAGLTPRQRQVASLLVLGLGNGDIGEQLGISVKAVEKHVRALFDTFGVRSRAAVAARLLQTERPRDQVAISRNGTSEFTLQ